MHLSATSHRFAVPILQMSVEAVQEHLNWSSEAMERCAVLSTEAGRAGQVRQLVHAPLPGQPANSCLLHQMSRLLMAGLTAASDACARASEMPYGLASAGSATRAAIGKAAAAVSCCLKSARRPLPPVQAVLLCTGFKDVFFAKFSFCRTTAACCNSVPTACFISQTNRTHMLGCCKSVGDVQQPVHAEVCHPRSNSRFGPQ